MENHDPDKKEESRPAKSKPDFIRRIGIGPDLAMFLTDFSQKPEILFSLSLDRRREIESQMDEILYSLGKG